MEVCAWNMYVCAWNTVICRWFIRVSPLNRVVCTWNWYLEPQKGVKKVSLFDLVFGQFPVWAIGSWDQNGLRFWPKKGSKGGPTFGYLILYTLSFSKAWRDWYAGQNGCKRFDHISCWKSQIWQKSGSWPRARRAREVLGPWPRSDLTPGQILRSDLTLDQLQGLVWPWTSAEIPLFKKDLPWNSVVCTWNDPFWPLFTCLEGIL